MDCSIWRATRLSGYPCVACGIDDIADRADERLEMGNVFGPTEGIGIRPSATMFERIFDLASTSWRYRWVGAVLSCPGIGRHAVRAGRTGEARGGRHGGPSVRTPAGKERAR